MAEVKWIKIVTDIFDDDKILLIESMPDADAIIVIWFKLLCLAGKQNNSGVFLLNGRIPYTEEMFATIFRRPLNTVRLALKTFEEFGMIEIVNNAVTIPNWEKHQKLDALEASREATKNRVARYREKQKLLVDSGNVTSNVTVTPSNADRIDKNREDKNISITRKSAESEMPLFNVFWEVYPRRVSKQMAWKAWQKLGDTRALCDTIIADVKRRVDGEWKGKDIQYIPYPSTYLNQRRWEDEQPSANTTDQSQQPTAKQWEQMSREEQAEAMKSGPYGRFY